MGGPFWSRKDDGAWSFPKGLVESDDATANVVARREFAEELGVDAPDAPMFDLGIVSSGRKRIRLLALGVSVDELDLQLHDEALARGIEGGRFEMEWPPKSGQMASFPEIDRAEWCPLEAALTRLSANQRAGIDLIARLAAAQFES